MNFIKKTLGNGQSIIDLAVQEYGCYEGLFLMLADNPDVVQAVSAILPPGTELRVRNPVPELNNTNRSVVAQYITDAVAVACGCTEDQDVAKTITLGTPVIDCGGSLSIPISQAGLSEAGTLKGLASFDGGVTFDDIDEELPIIPLFEVPISNYGEGIPNGTYMLKFVSNEDPTVESNIVTFVIDCPFERAINLDSVDSSVESNVTGTPVDLTVNFTTYEGYDGTDPLAWAGTETFQLQYSDGMGGWIDAGSPISNSGDTVQDVQLPNGEYEFRLVCVEYSVVSTNVNTGVGFGHSRAMAYFSLNIGNDGSNDGLLYKVTIDGVEYTVNGNSTMTGIKDMQTAMKSLLDANTQGFTVDEFSENGSPSNYFFKISAPIGTNATWNGKTIRVECGNTESTVQGYNITVNGVYSPALGGIAGFGTAPGEGTFTGGY